MAQSPEALSAERTDSSERSVTGAGWGTAAWGEVLMTTRSILRRGPLTMLSTMPVTGVTRHMAVSFLSCIRGVPRLTSSPSLDIELGEETGEIVRDYGYPVGHDCLGDSSVAERALKTHVESFLEVDCPSHLFK